MKLEDIKGIVMERVCIYDAKVLNNIWTGYMRNLPAKYHDLEIKVMGAKRKGILDIGVEWLPEE